MRVLFTGLFFLLASTTLFGQIARVHNGPILGTNQLALTTEDPAAEKHLILSGDWSLDAGILYDTGGETSNYGDNEDYSSTINVDSNCDFIRFIVTYELENGYDSLFIRSSIGGGSSYAEYTGTGSDTVIVAQSSVTIHFKSDNNVNYSGFAVQWQAMCENDTAPDIYDDLYIAGNKLMWIPWKGAFRAGRHINTWREDKVGDFSTAFGENTEASEYGGMAWGVECSATKPAATAWGHQTKATEPYATAFGLLTIASGNNSTAFGSVNKASGFNSTVFGLDNKAIGDLSTVWGEKDSATAQFSTVWGTNNKAQSYLETVCGRFNQAGGTPDSWVNTERLFVVGNGTGAGPAPRNNAFIVLKDGSAYLDGFLTQGSDKTLKKDIEPIANAGELLAQINGYTYYWKNAELRGTDKQVGIIAQEVQKVLPDLVKDSGNGHLGVNYIGLIPVLIEANKELRLVSGELEVENNRQDAIIEKQAKEIDNLKSEIQKQEVESERINERVAKLESLMERLDTDMEYCCTVQSHGDKKEELLEENSSQGYLEQKRTQSIH